MKHFTTDDFWKSYNKLPQNVRDHSDRAYDLLKENPRHPSLYLKKIGRYWAVRIGIHYRALGVEVADGILWFWIGTHSEYDNLLS